MPVFDTNTGQFSFLTKYNVLQKYNYVLTLITTRVHATCLEELGEIGNGGVGVSEQGLVGEAEEGNHSQAAVLDLSGLKLEGALRGLAGQVQGVEDTAGVAAGLEVLGAVALDLNVAHGEHLNHHQGGKVEGDGVAEVAGALELDLAGINLSLRVIY
eukprot:1193617-Prorocentrum_minimum.AAC.5